MNENNLNIGQRKCPDCGSIRSSSISDVCICKQNIDKLIKNAKPLPEYLSKLINDNIDDLLIN